MDDFSTFAVALGMIAAAAVLIMNVMILTV